MKACSPSQNVQASINQFGQRRLRHTAWEFTGALPHGLSLEALSNCGAPCCPTASDLCALQGRARQTSLLGERRGGKKLNITCMHEVAAFSLSFFLLSLTQCPVTKKPHSPTGATRDGNRRPHAHRLPHWIPLPCPCACTACLPIVRGCAIHRGG